MRSYLLLAFVVLAATHPAVASPIRVTQASATYWTATNDVEIIVRFDRELDLTQRDFFQFWGGTPPRVWPPEEGFTFHNDPLTFGSDMRLTLIDYGPPHDEETLGIIPYQLESDLFTVTIPFDTLHLSSPLFDFEAFARTEGGFAWPGLTGTSFIDKRVVFVPEPPAINFLGALFLTILAVCFFRKTVLSHWVRQLSKSREK